MSVHNFYGLQPCKFYLHALRESKKRIYIPSARKIYIVISCKFIVFNLCDYCLRLWLGQQTSRSNTQNNNLHAGTPFTIHYSSLIFNIFSYNAANRSLFLDLRNCKSHCFVMLTKLIGVESIDFVLKRNWIFIKEQMIKVSHSENLFYLLVQANWFYIFRAWKRQFIDQSNVH